MGRGLREEVFTATEVCIVFVTQRCVRTQFLTELTRRLDAITPIGKTGL